MATQIKDTIIDTFKLDRENVDKVIARIEELIHEGNVRRLIIKNEDGRTLVEIPLTFGVIGAALLPIFAAIGAIAALATRCTIVVERQDEDTAVA